MNSSPQQPDEALRKLLREGRPSPDLPPGFNSNVWRRIEAAESANEPAPALSWLDRVAGWLLQPRLAIASLAFLIVLGGSLGVATGVSYSKQAERDRYVASVSPLAVRN